MKGAEPPYEYLLGAILCGGHFVGPIVRELGGCLFKYEII